MEAIDQARQPAGLFVRRNHREVQFNASMIFPFASMMILAACDIALNTRDRLSAQHIIVDECIFVSGLIGILVMGWRLKRSMQGEHMATVEATRLSQLVLEMKRARNSDAEQLVVRLEQTRQEVEHWKGQACNLMAGLGTAIDAQFCRWSLTPAEREVGLLLLKGLSHKEIARVRKVSEATVRQQAQCLYRKAEIGGRNDLAAYFLEDLLLPASVTSEVAMDGHDCG